MIGGRFSWFENGGSSDGSGGDWISATACQSTLTPSAPEERRGPLLPLYSKGLFGGIGAAGAALAGTATPARSGGDKTKDDASVAASSSPSSVAPREDGGSPSAEEISRRRRRSESSGSPPVSDVVGAQTFTARWADVVNRATISKEPSQAAQVGEQTVAAAPTPSGTGRKWSGKDWTPRPKDENVPIGPARKWTAKIWNSGSSGASWRAGEAWSEPREATADAGTASTSAAGTGASVAIARQESTAGTSARIETVVVSTVEYGRDRGVVMDELASGRRRAVNESDWAVETSGELPPFSLGLKRSGELDETGAVVVSAAAAKSERRSWRVWCGPTRASDLCVSLPEEKEGKEDVYATAREELTVYLLATGATHYEVAGAASALIAVQPELALTGSTWKRWRDNLEGLRRTGFTGTKDGRLDDNIVRGSGEKFRLLLLLQRRRMFAAAHDLVQENAW